MNNNKYLLIEKIASVAELNCNDSNKKDTALKIASQMLKVAAEKQKDLELKIAELSLENSKFKQEKIASMKKEIVDDLVLEMFNKGVIKKSDIELKKEELEDMDENSLKVLKNTISSIPEKTAEEYVSNLNFLYGDNNIKEKENLCNAINNYLK